MALRFAALRNKHVRPYLVGAALGMMGDNIEHVITYWVLWEKFHSELLVGFQVISHWVPFLLFSYFFGSLADRFDCRRVIQVGQALYIAVSLTWAVLFFTGHIEIWSACVLLVLHGCASAIWGPAEQLMLHDFVEPEVLPSAVRLNATFKSLGLLFGPVVGSVLMALFGPVGGLIANACFYLPLTIYLFITPFTGHVRTGVKVVRRGWAELIATLRSVRHNRQMMAVIALSGLGSFFIGVSLQSAMPVFAGEMHNHGDSTYMALLLATGAGGVLGGLALEASGRVRADARIAVIATLIYGVGILVFSLTYDIPLAAVMLFIAGVANMTSMTVGQTIVQLDAKPEERGKVIGLYNTAANGLRFGSGLTVGVVGALIGLRWSLTWSCVALLVGTLIVAWFVRRAPRAAVQTP